MPKGMGRCDIFIPAKDGNPAIVIGLKTSAKESPRTLANAAMRSIEDRGCVSGPCDAPVMAVGIGIRARSACVMRLPPATHRPLPLNHCMMMHRITLWRAWTAAFMEPFSKVETVGTALQRRGVPASRHGLTEKAGNLAALDRGMRPASKPEAAIL